MAQYGNTAQKPKPLAALERQVAKLLAELEAEYRARGWDKRADRVEFCAVRLWEDASSHTLALHMRYDREAVAKEIGQPLLGLYD